MVIRTLKYLLLTKFYLQAVPLVTEPILKVPNMFGRRSGGNILKIILKNDIKRHQQCLKNILKKNKVPNVIIILFLPIKY